MKNTADFITKHVICILLAATSVYASSPTQPNGGETMSGMATASSFVQQSTTPDGELILTLEESLRIALQNNLDIRITEESLAKANAKMAEERSAMFPYLGAEASYLRLDEELAASVGPISMVFEEEDVYKAGIVLRQPIFAGGRLNAAFRASMYARDAEHQKKEAVEEEIIYQVTRAYHYVQVAAEFRGVAAEAVKLLEVHEHNVAILVKEGAAPQLDLLRTRTELANAHRDLNIAENNLDLALSTLKNLLCIDLETPVEVSQQLGGEPCPGENLFYYTEYALAHRAELSALQAQLKATGEGFKAARGEYLPTIGLEGRYEYIKGDMRELDGDNHWTLGIKAEVPVWNWGQTASKVHQAESEVEKARKALQKSRDNIRLQVRQSYLDLKKSYKNIVAAQAALDASKEAYRQARVLYLAGQGTNTDVLDAHTALSQTRANHARAQFDCAEAIAALNRATGTVPADLISRRP